MNKFRVGIRVTISDKLKGSITESLHKLDKNGNMLKMQGCSYHIRTVNSRFIKIYNPDAGRSYTFNEEDITPYETELPPQEFKFNENLLDV